MKKIVLLLMVIISLGITLNKNKDVFFEDCNSDILVETNISSQENYIYDQSAEYLGNKDVKIIDGYKREDLNKRIKVLGLYEPSVKINALYDYHYNIFKGCGKINKVKLEISLISDIYISKEAQQFHCTKNLVESHEKKHLKFELDGLEKMKEESFNIVNNNLKNIDEKDMKKYEKALNLRLENMKKNLYDELKLYVNPLHKSIDNKENYKKEFSQCPSIENEMMFDVNF